MDLTKKTRPELIALCKAAHIKGYTNKKVEELRELLQAEHIIEEHIIEEQCIKKPFLKWVGGKTQIIKTVFEHFPSAMQNYHEPFLGGGSVLLALLSQPHLKITGKIYASDLNVTLISVYQYVQKQPAELIAAVKKITAAFAEAKGTVVNRKPATFSEAQSSPESYYYWIRQTFNALPPAAHTTLEAAALFLFLNKTCFRGMYREGPNGFNVPYGNYNQPSILDEAHIYAVSALIQPVIFTAQSYQTALKEVQPGDFVYLDPPYAPLNEKSFVGYNAEGFTLEQHNQLFAQCASLAEKKVRFLLSNAEVPLVTTAFPAPVYQTRVVSCRRAIHAKAPAARTNEVLITNKVAPYA
jgi:DNA adenine methylase